MSVPACCRWPPSAATAENDSSTPATSVNKVWKGIVLLVRRRPLRHRFGLVDLGPQRHGDEEGEIEEGQDAADDGLDRIGARAGADLAEPDEADGQDAEHRLRQQTAIAVRLDLGAI